jgi:hypothetical protein
MGIPLQVLETGVTVNRATIGILLIFVAVNTILLPDPDAATPIPVLSLVQL